VADVPTAADVSPDNDAERRQLTIMFCDLVGSSALSARLDPEDFRKVLIAYNTRVTDVVRRYKGNVVRYMGDGVLAYFGYPQAEEESAIQATRAGLALVEAVSALQNEIGVGLQVRVGIATGVVVVGDFVGDGVVREQAAVGQTPNLAARLQKLANPGAVLIDPNSHRLTSGYFDYRDLGLRVLKGWPEPIRVWQVIGSSGVKSRFEARHKSKLPPLLGREAEIELLLSDWRDAGRMQGRVAMLTGEPGIGKRISRSPLMSSSRKSRTSPCAISAPCITPTRLSFRLLVRSSMPQTLSAAIHQLKSSPNSKRFWHDPQRIPST